MARPLRIAFPDVVYYVTSRGKAQAAIYADATDRTTSLALLAQGLRGCRTSRAVWRPPDDFDRLLEVCGAAWHPWGLSRFLSVGMYLCREACELGEWMLMGDPGGAGAITFDCTARDALGICTGGMETAGLVGCIDRGVGGWPGRIVLAHCSAGLTTAPLCWTDWPG